VTNFSFGFLPIFGELREIAHQLYEVQQPTPDLYELWKVIPVLHLRNLTPKAGSFRNFKSHLWWRYVVGRCCSFLQEFNPSLACTIFVVLYPTSVLISKALTPIPQFLNPSVASKTRNLWLHFRLISKSISISCQPGRQPPFFRSAIYV